MILWLFVSTMGVLCFPLREENSTDVIGSLLADVINSTVVFDVENVTTTTTPMAVASKPAEKLIDPSIFITLKKDDWRDAHDEKMIIWSLESHHHPEFGKMYSKGKKKSQRHTQSSQIMSFMILGSVIGFILYTYLSHVIMMRKLNERKKTAQLRELLERSAIIMAGSAQQAHLTAGMGERRRSLINMFQHFKL